MRRPTEVRERPARQERHTERNRSVVWIAENVDHSVESFAISMPQYFEAVVRRWLHIIGFLMGQKFHKFVDSHSIDET